MTATMLNMSIEQLRLAVREAGYEAYRADQLADWVYKKGVTDPAAMANLPAGLTDQIAALDSRVVGKSLSCDGTLKCLIELHDGERIETVMIPTSQRVTVCLSTQAGCAMGCGFCASAIGGLRRNLTAGEILQQLLHLRRESGRAITHVVFMGMGEPLANYDATVAAVRAIIDPQRFGISARRVTVSTVGLPEQIRRLAREELPITLAISLHAPNDALRRQLIPAAARTPFADVLAAAEEFFESKHRIVTLEYVLLAGVNDTSLCSRALAKIARRLKCKVNLIRYNRVKSLPFEMPTKEAVQKFAAVLRRNGVKVTVRQSRGLDADAACGQLTRRAATSDSDAPEN